MTALSKAYNRLNEVIDDDTSASDALRLLMNSFEMYHHMVLALITKELGHHDSRTLSNWTDGIDGLADSLRARAILIDAYLAPGDHLTTSR